MDLKERIKQFCDSIGFSIREFERVCGLSRGNISNMTGALGSDKLAKIIDTYPELNLYWLVTGEGEMIRDYPPSISPEPLGPSAIESHLKSIIKEKEARIEEQARTIGRLEERLENSQAYFRGSGDVLSYGNTGEKPADVPPVQTLPKSSRATGGQLKASESDK